MSVLDCTPDRLDIVRGVPRAVHDALADGRPIRVLTVVDQWSRQSPVLEVASHLSGATVGQALDRVLPAAHGLRSITVDHGTECMSRPLEDWAYQRGVQLDFIRPGTPWDTPSSSRSTGGSGTSA